MATVTVRTKIDDVTGDVLGDEFYEVVLTRWTREGDKYVRGSEQRILDTAPETITALTSVGTTRAVRGRKPTETAAPEPSES